MLVLINWDTQRTKKMNSKKEEDKERKKENKSGGFE